MDNPTEPNVPTTTSTDQTITQNVGATPTVGESSAKSGPNYWMIAAIVLFLLVLVCGAGLAYFLMAKPSSQTAAVPAPTISPTSTPSPISLPPIQNGVLAASDTSKWKTATDKDSGYQVSYPPTWFILAVDPANPNQINNIQNWNPNSGSNPSVPMGQKQTKFDVSFATKRFTDLSAVINGWPEGTVVDRITKFDGLDNMTVYFLDINQKSSSPALLVVFVTKDGNYFSWGGVGDVVANESTLQRIALSAHKSNTRNVITNDGLKTIMDLTQPMVWSTPVTDSRQNYPGIMLQGESMTASIPEKGQDKLAPLLATDTVLTSTYGWVNDPTGSADGPNASIVTFKKTNGSLTQWMIIASNFSKKQYTVFVGVQE